MIVALSGSTGFIGRFLAEKLRGLEWTVRVINRESFAMTDQEFTDQKIEGADVVINLAGATISKKWTPGYKQEIISSRVDTTRKIAGAIKQAKQKPAVFISASGIGVYDHKGVHTELSVAMADSFLANVCRNWEQEAMAAEGDTRVAIFRLGVVLGQGGGVLQKMYLPFSIGLGARLGNGNQTVSFIHIKDLADAMIFAIENPSVCGIVNAVSPYPSNNAEFTDKLAKVLKQPAWLTVPSMAVKMMYGETSQIMLEGQHVIPEKLLQAGFRFTYPTIQNALMEVYG